MRALTLSISRLTLLINTSKVSFAWHRLSKVSFFLGQWDVLPVGVRIPGYLLLFCEGSYHASTSFWFHAD